MLRFLYHGSDHIIPSPSYGYGKKYNDYGLGFYCTEDIDLAKEWAVDLNRDGFVNYYELECSDLRVLNLCSSEYGILDWLAILLNNREVVLSYPLQREARDYIVDNYLINISEFDVIEGYRADDSYFSFARDFLSGAISYKQLGEAMRLGKLGNQIVLKSQKAFDKLIFKGAVEVVADEWFSRKRDRDILARKQYSNLKFQKGDLYIHEMLREEIKRDDARLR